MKLLKRLTFALGILMGVVNIGMGAMSNDEWNRAKYNCAENDKSACQAIIDNGLPSVGQCDKESCGPIGAVYYKAERYKEAIPYFEKAIALGDNKRYPMFLLARSYDKLQDYYNAKKYYEIGCSKGNEDLSQADNCYNLGLMYNEGQGVRQDYYKAAELYKKACDMKYGAACNNLGLLYAKGQGVKQNHSTAKHYFGKACDLGEQVGCNNYKILYEQGIK